MRSTVARLSALALASLLIVSAAPPPPVMGQGEDAADQEGDCDDGSCGVTANGSVDHADEEDGGRRHEHEPAKRLPTRF